LQIITAIKTDNTRSHKSRFSIALKHGELQWKRPSELGATGKTKMNVILRKTQPTSFPTLNLFCENQFSIITPIMLLPESGRIGLNTF
jgi:hypothetical protein